MLDDSVLVPHRLSHLWSRVLKFDLNLIRGFALKSRDIMTCLNNSIHIPGKYLHHWFWSQGLHYFTHTPCNFSHKFPVVPHWCWLRIHTYPDNKFIFSLVILPDNSHHPIDLHGYFVVPKSLGTLIFWVKLIFFPRNLTVLGISCKWGVPPSHPSLQDFPL